MAQNEGKAGDSDLTKGVPLAALNDGGMMPGRVDDEEVLLVRRGDEVFAIGAHCTPLPRAACRGSAGWRHAALSLAPCGLRPADRRGGADARAQSAAVLERRAARRQGFRDEPEGRCETLPGARGRRHRGAAAHRRRGRRRRRLRRGRNPPPRRLPGRPGDGQQRRYGAGRPTEPVQGLPRRQRPGRLGAAALRRLVSRQRDRPAARTRARPASIRAPARSSSPTAPS